MEAILKSGKIIHGKLAEILVKKGSATEVQKPKVQKPKRKTKK